MDASTPMPPTCVFLQAMRHGEVFNSVEFVQAHGAGLGESRLNVLRLFSMAQTAGYAAGGCWTHIGSAQSVVAYAFIRRDLDTYYIRSSGPGR